MTYTNTHYSDPKNLDRSQQVSRVILATVLLGITFTAPVGFLGWYSVLPLVAIYPLVTGLIGWDPIYDLFGLEQQHGMDGKLETTSRVELAITGLVLIGSAFVLPATVSSVFSVFALAGIYPTLVALMGEDLLQSTTTREIAHREVHVGSQPKTAEGTAAAAAAIEEVRKGRSKDTRKAA